ncbi:MAG TPA: hypothetical protein DEB10_11595 [Ruminococcaceae bacterium]|jgi:restriction system protein|nr:hypothetical protein [Oscillospiraceae bacterium]HCA28260.1 hypothetical protein [Oscillospiraceae bacterium]
MLLAYFICVLLYIIFDFVSRLVNKTRHKKKINRLLATVNTKDELLYMRETEILNMLALLFQRKGYKVKTTDKCGEFVNGLLLDDVIFVELQKNSPKHLLEIETAIKFTYCMQQASIHRGMLITLGDFKLNTKLYCHKYVIECVNGDQLLAMIREVRMQTDPVKIKQPRLSNP